MFERDFSFFISFQQAFLTNSQCRLITPNFQGQSIMLVIVHHVWLLYHQVFVNLVKNIKLPVYSEANHHELQISDFQPSSKFLNYLSLQGILTAQALLVYYSFLNRVLLTWPGFKSLSNWIYNWLLKLELLGLLIFVLLKCLLIRCPINLIY